MKQLSGTNIKIELYQTYSCISFTICSDLLRIQRTAFLRSQSSEITAISILVRDIHQPTESCLQISVMYYGSPTSKCASSNRESNVYREVGLGCLTLEIEINLPSNDFCITKIEY